MTRIVYLRRIIQRQLIFFSIILIMIVSVSCSSNAIDNDGTLDSSAPELQEPVGLKYDYAPVTRRDIALLNTYEAYVRPETFALAFSQDGYIADARVVPGSYVEKGDVLAILDQDSAQDALDGYMEALLRKKGEAEDSLRLLELDIEEAQEHYDDLLDSLSDSVMTERGIIERTDAIVLAELSIDKAMTRFDRTDEQYEETISRIETAIDALIEQMAENTLHAPFSGRVLSIVNNGGEAQVRANETYIEMLDENALFLQSEYIQQGLLTQAAEVTASIEGEIYTLTPREIDHRVMIDRSLSGQEMFSEHDFTDDTLGKIKPGSYAQIILKMRPQVNALTIPMNALYRAGGEVYVYRLAGERRERVEVKVLYETPAYAVIEEGLTEGDLIYVKDA